MSITCATNTMMAHSRRPCSAHFQPPVGQRWRLVYGCAVQGCTTAEMTAPRPKGGSPLGLDVKEPPRRRGRCHFSLY